MLLVAKGKILNNIQLNTHVQAAPINVKSHKRQIWKKKERKGNLAKLDTTSKSNLMI